LKVVRVVECHFGVVLVLDLRVGKAVADGQSGEVEGEQPVFEVVVSPPDTVGDGRCIMSSVGFAYKGFVKKMGSR
jgi:hypothetical protein